jgi:hypothetical protein
VLFEAFGIGINLSEPPWQEMVESAFTPVRQRYARAVIKVSVVVERMSGDTQSAPYRCRATTDVFGWHSFQVESDGEGPEAAVNQSAEKLLATLASILEGA